MERYLLVLATLLAAAAGFWGMRSVHRGARSPWTVVWMVAVLACQFGFLVLRGELRKSCPLNDPGEILAYLAWAVTLFYLLVGPAYRLSLLGLFSIPLVVVMQMAALAFLFTSSDPVGIVDKGVARSVHSAVAGLAYGALGLAAISGVMFITLDRQLKERKLASGLFHNMPSAHLLLVSMERLMWIGTGLLTVGLVAGLMMRGRPGVNPHLVMAFLAWFSYLALLVFKVARGISGRKLSLAAVGIFLVSLLVFASI